MYYCREKKKLLKNITSFRKLISNRIMSSCLLGPGSKLLFNDTPSDFLTMASNTMRHLVEMLSNLNTP